MLRANHCAPKCERQENLRSIMRIELDEQSIPTSHQCHREDTVKTQTATLTK